MVKMMPTVVIGSYYKIDTSEPVCLVTVGGVGCLSAWDSLLADLLHTAMSSLRGSCVKFPPHTEKKSVIHVARSNNTERTHIKEERTPITTYFQAWRDIPHYMS